MKRLTREILFDDIKTFYKNNYEKINREIKFSYTYNIKINDIAFTSTYYYDKENNYFYFLYINFPRNFAYKLDMDETIKDLAIYGLKYKEINFEGNNKCSLIV
jgi:hypothetical protein